MSSKRCSGCYMYNHDCEIDTTYHASKKCPCRICIVKVNCRETCDAWYKYVKGIIHELEIKTYPNTSALRSHVNHKVKRLDFIKCIRSSVLSQTPIHHIK